MEALPANIGIFYTFGFPLCSFVMCGFFPQLRFDGHQRGGRFYGWGRLRLLVFFLMFGIFTDCSALSPTRRCDDEKVSFS